MTTTATATIADASGNTILCYVEHTVGEYTLCTPVDTPVCLVRVAEDDDDEDELIEELDAAEEVLQVADSVLSECGLTLIRSAATLTVAGDLGDCDENEDEDEDVDDREAYEILVSFLAGGKHYAICIPLDPLFIVAKNNIVVPANEIEQVCAMFEEHLA